MEALGLTVPPAVGAALADPANETPKPGDAAFRSAEYRIIATPAAALAAAATLAKRRGYEVIDLGDAVTGEAREVAKAHAKLARETKAADTGSPSSAAASCRHRAQCPGPGRTARYAGLALALESRGISALAAAPADRSAAPAGDRPGGRHHRRSHAFQRTPPGRPEVPRQ
jgi:hydroxypyruvate reductase